jgi:uncharacterized phage infection (PIP) family protein YhgE
MRTRWHTVIDIIVISIGTILFLWFSQHHMEVTTMTEELTARLFDIRNEVRQLSTAEAETIADFYMNSEDFLPADDASALTAVQESIRRMEEALSTFKALTKQVTR